MRASSQNKTMASSLRRCVPRFIAHFVSSLSGRPLVAIYNRKSGIYLAEAFSKHGRKTFATTASRTIGESDGITLHFIEVDGQKVTVKAQPGDTIQEAAANNDINLQSACEGTLACSTCHVIFDAKEIDKLNLDEPSHEEVELLEKSYAGCTETSRLGCQIELTKDFEGITVVIPAAGLAADVD